MKHILAGILLISVIGCSGGPPAETVAKPEVATTPRSSVSGPEKLAPPDFTVRTALRMIRKGEELRVGDPMETALRVFREEKNAYRISEMPAGWKDPAYSCQGWDTGTTGFAAITLDEKVVLGLWHEDRVDESRLQEILADYDRMLDFAPSAVTGSRVRYWFWDQAPHRLMICAVQIPVEGMSISIAIGDAKAMDVLRMNPVAADRDRQAAEKLFQEGMKARESS